MFISYICILNALNLGVVSGALNSTAGVIRNVSSGLSLLSGDQAYIEDRNKSRQQATRGGMASGFRGGGSSVVSGFTSGVTGLFTKPYEEAKKDGALGFVRGVGMGVFGAAVKPVIGVTDGITHMAQGISNQLSDKVEKKHFRPPRAFLRSAADPTELILPKLNLVSAYCQAFVLAKASKQNIQDAFVDAIILNKNDEMRVVVSEKFVYWNVSRERLWCRPWTAISHCIFSPPQSVGIVVYENSGRKETVSISCSSVAIAADLYRSLSQNAFRMGNPHDVASFDRVFGNKGAQEVTVKEGLFDGYNFGTANSESPLPLPHDAKSSSDDIIQRAKERIHFVTNEDWPTLDRVCWSMVHEYYQSHSGLRSFRCCLLLLINKSARAIQINRTQLVEGKAVYLLPGHGFVETSKSIASGGFIVLFGIATSSTIGDCEGIVLNINTSVADIIVSNHLSASSCENTHGSRGGFLEKSVSDSWSKYVVCITK